MNLVQSIIQKLQGGSFRQVEGIASLTALIEKNKLPEVMPAAWVVSLGGDAEAPAQITGLIRQLERRRIGIVLVARVAGDAKGGKTQEIIDALEEEVLNKLLGFLPDTAIDGMIYLDGRLHGINNGAILYQMNFQCQRHLRASNPS